MSERANDNCRTCGHPASWHRHDDENCHRLHAQPCHPNTAPFRCHGYDVDGQGYPAGTPETRCGCPTFVKAKESPAPSDAYPLARRIYDAFAHVADSAVLRGDITVGDLRTLLAAVAAGQEPKA